MSRLPRRRPPHSDPSPPLSPLPPPVQAPQGVWRIVTPLLMLTYLVYAILHAAWVPTGQTGYQNAPDEAAHVSYVKVLASGKLPTKELADRDPVGQSYEWHQPPLYYAWTTLFAPLGAQWMRLASIVLGLLCLLVIFRASRLLFPDDPVVAVVATGFAALLPTHIAITSTVNNDVMTELVFSTILLLQIQCLMRGLTFWRAGCLGCVLGAALLVKATAILLIPIIGIGLVLMYLAGESAAKIARGAGIILAWTLLISGWWFIRNERLYGEFLPLKEFARAFAGTALAQPFIERDGVVNYIELVSRWTFQSFWAVFGNSISASPQRGRGLPLFLPEQIYLLPLIITVFSAAGFVRFFLTRVKATQTGVTQLQKRCLLLLLLTLLFVALSFIAFLAKYFQTQGRYLFPAMLPISILVSAGWLSLFPPKYKPLAAGILLGLLALLSLLFLTSVQAAA